MENQVNTAESTGLSSRTAGSSVPQEQLARICEDVAQGIAKVLLGDIQQVVEDIRRQYKDHNQLLARQELALQHLRSWAQKLPVGKSQQDGAKNVFACGLCQNDPGSIADESQRDNSSSEVFMLGDGTSSSRVEGVVTVPAKSETVVVEQRHWAGSSKEHFRHTRKKRTAQEVQQWVAKKLAETMAPMSPRPCPPPPPPHPCPHREETADAHREEQAEFQVQFDAGANFNPNLGGNPPMRPSAGDDDGTSQKGDAVERAPSFDKNQVSPRMLGSDGSPFELDPDQVGKRRQHEGVKPRGSGVVGPHDKTLFGDMGMDKTQLDKEEYNVAQFYHDTGYSQQVARSDVFANITLLVIFLNAVYIGYDADQNDKDNLYQAEMQFQIMENAFCFFFTAEWTIRFCAFRLKMDCLKDMWFKFDTILVLFMLIETVILPPILTGALGIPTGLVKLVRLLRLARMARLMRAFPELLAMIKGVKVAARAVSSALLMMIGLIYVFAIILFTLLKGHPAESPAEIIIDSRFRRLGITMWTLLVDGTFLDGLGVVSRSLMDTNEYHCLCILIIFVLLSALTVMNMLIGVLCEVVSAVAAAEKEDSAIRMVKDKLLTLLRELDEDGSGEISREEIQQVLDNDEAMGVLENLQVDVGHLMEQLDMFFEEGGDLTIQQIMDLILMLRGDRPPTMKDMLHGQTFNRWKQNKAFEDVRCDIKKSIVAAATESWFEDDMMRPSTVQSVFKGSEYDVSDLRL